MGVIDEEGGDSSSLSSSTSSFHRKPDGSRHKGNDNNKKKKRLLRTLLRRIQSQTTSLLTFVLFVIGGNARTNNATKRKEQGDDEEEADDPYVLFDNNQQQQQAMDNNFNNEKAIQMAAIFLQDFEHGRSPTLPINHIKAQNDESTGRGGLVAVSDHVLALHQVRFSKLWRLLRIAAVLVLFASSGLENSSAAPQSFAVGRAALAQAAALAIFGLDMVMRQEIMRDSVPVEPLRHAMLVMMALFAAEVLYHYGSRLIVMLFMGDNDDANNSDNENQFWYFRNSVLKPLALFYLSDKARKACQSIARITPVVSRVLVLELVLILAFGAVACQLYAEYSGFASLAQAWFSLFQCTYRDGSWLARVCT